MGGHEKPYGLWNDMVRKADDRNSGTDDQQSHNTSWAGNLSDRTGNQRDRSAAGARWRRYTNKGKSDYGSGGTDHRRYCGRNSGYLYKRGMLSEPAGICRK